VVTGVMADRTMKKYGGTVQPDETVTDPAEVVPRALAWLRGPIASSSGHGLAW
jgi:hypothetical protein